MSFTLPPPAAWSYVPSEVWQETVVTDKPEHAQLAKQYGRQVTALYDGAAVLRAVADLLNDCGRAALEHSDDRVYNLMHGLGDELRAAADAITPTREMQDAHGDAE